MKNTQHYLLDEYDNVTHTFDAFNKDVIKAAIVAYLIANPSGCITHEKDQVNKRYAGNEILNYYEVNKKNGAPSVIRFNVAGNFIGYKSLL